MNTTRRQFLGAGAAAVAAAAIVPRHVLGGPKFIPPSEKVHVALVGAGGQGRTNARALFEEHVDMSRIRAAIGLPAQGPPT